MRGFKANRPCAVSAGAEAAAMVDSADLKIERLLVRNEPFRVRNAYFLCLFLVVLVVSLASRSPNFLGCAFAVFLSEFFYGFHWR